MAFPQPARENLAISSLSTDTMGTDHQDPLKLLIDTLQDRVGDRIEEYRIPPPAFLTMQGKVLGVEPERGTLTTQFPILEDHLNPYRTLQGGFLAAMFDNTIGPLSMLVAPPNVTRRLEITYSEPLSPQMSAITIKATYDSREGRRLFFRAEARDPQEHRVARAQATHWILPDNLGDKT